MFTGDSCFPLSPCKEALNSGAGSHNNFIVSKHDQLIKVLELIGTEDISMASLNDNQPKVSNHYLAQQIKSNKFDN